MARRSAEEALRRRPALTENLGTAARITAAADHGRLTQLRTRANRTGDQAEHADLQVETALSEALLAGIRQPIVRVDGVLAVFLSGNPRVLAIVDSRS